MALSVTPMTANTHSTMKIDHAIVGLMGKTPTSMMGV